MLETAILIVMVIVALAIIGLILVQQGKGADMGASFGSGASNTVFGSQGSGNFLTRTTGILVTIFFICCLVLGWFANHKSGSRGATIDFSAPATPVELKEVPAAPDVPDVAPVKAAGGDVPAEPAAGAPAVQATVTTGAATAPAGEPAKAAAGQAPTEEKTK